MKMLLNGEGVKATLLASRVALTPSPLLRLRQLLSVVRPLPHSGLVLHPRGRPGPYRSLPVTAEGLSAHRARSNAPAARDSGFLWSANADTVSEPCPTCVALCRLAQFSPADASPAGTRCSRAPSAHRAHWRRRSAQGYLGADPPNTLVPAYRFSAPHGDYHSSDTVGCARA